MRKCLNCGKTGNLHKHHIIHGHGKRRAFETQDSLIDICFDCHRSVHEATGKEIDIKFKLYLQAVYFKRNYDKEKVRRLLDGKLYLVDGEIWGYKNEPIDDIADTFYGPEWMDID